MAHEGNVHAARAAELNETLGEMLWEAQRTKHIMLNMCQEIEIRRGWQNKAKVILERVVKDADKSLKYQIEQLLKEKI